MPDELGGPLREELARKLADFEKQTGLGWTAFSTDPMNRRGGPRPLRPAHEGLVPSPDYDAKAVRELVVGAVRLGSALLSDPLAPAAPSKHELAAVREITRALEKYRTALLRAQLMAARVSVLTRLAEVYAEHRERWPPHARKGGHLDPKRDADARRALVEDIRKVLGTVAYRSAVGDLGDVDLEAYVFASSEATSVEHMERGGGPIRFAAALLEKLTEVTALGYQKMRRRMTAIERSRALWPFRLSLPSASLSPYAGGQFADAAADFVRGLFLEQLAEEPGDYVVTGVIPKDQ